ncbi:(2Fe-2S) ferredoxin domain-containing protein [Chroococcidiopsis sp. CCMEE 29]|uniref:(2Fe-2S) ferredoxin domain-containing protein n=1 Tax=Chroococcidiopsis sp. CCMEE 29 TaxID=155894 RepID=UPI00202195ED|nr:(2Fe-2S) ferredoxin domain-containing protein [Chroococcidiopsis sp. CCMEE 29]
MQQSHNSSTQCVLVCQNRTCRKQGAGKVLTAFQAYSMPDVTVIGSGCLGQCGMGPMVKVIPAQVWYCRVQPDEVPAVVKRHLLGGQPIATMLYPKFHPCVER